MGGETMTFLAIVGFGTLTAPLPSPRDDCLFVKKFCHGPAGSGFGLLHAKHPLPPFFTRGSSILFFRGLAGLAPKD